MSAPGEPAAPAPALEIVRPGLLTTVQDLGRPGQGRFGVSPSGAMDPLAQRVANRLAGSPESAAGLEVTGPGCEILFLRTVRFALAGGDLDAALDGQPLPAFAAALAPAGARLAFRSRRRGARACLALAGGLDVPLVLGSAATDLGAGLGGVGGRPLRAGQRLALRPADPTPPPAPLDSVVAALAAALAPLYPEGPAVLRLVPEDDPAVLPPARARLDGSRFILSSRSGRTGYRFEGDPLPGRPDGARLSEPTAPGAFQLPPDGLPILLMADRNTIGGYPRLGHLATADRARAAQLWPGDPVELRSIPGEQAVAEARAVEARLQSAFALLPG